jgi:hypothetical protein
VPDILVFYNTRVYGIELKTDKGVLSKAQVEMFPRLRNAGMIIHVCRNIEDVHDALYNHLIPMRPIHGYSPAKARRPPQLDARTP